MAPPTALQRDGARDARHDYKLRWLEFQLAEICMDPSAHFYFRVSYSITCISEFYLPRH